MAGKEPTLELRTLGGLTILLDGQPIDALASRKAEALLVYLAVTARPHAREHLGTLLWDDRPLARSLANLSVLLNSLKKQLEPFLQIERQAIAISSKDRISVDLLELREAAEAWEARFQAGDREPTRNLGHLEDVLATYKGDFLQGFHLREARGLDEWASVQREQAQRQVLAGLRWLAEAYQQEGGLEASSRCLRKALFIDPLQEELQRFLMRVLALSNRYTDALRQFRACADVLKAELGVEPSRATRGLYDRILARRERATDNLPAATSEIIGRERELAEIFLRMSEPGIRLLTLVGAGGIGKTKLAIEAARRLKSRFLEGVWIADLAPIDDPALVPLAIGRVFSMPESIPIRQEVKPKDVLIERLIQFMTGKEQCLILDNCEHVLDASARLVDRLLQGCPELKVLVTTRERLDIPQEHLFVVDPLELPSFDHEDTASLGLLRGNDSIRLFVERAQAVREGFQLSMDNLPVLVRICRALDGMPLAIEIAASRLRSVSLSEMTDHLEESMRDLGRDHAGALPRHQTIEAAIDWSYHLLSEDETRLFKITTIFRGGFDQRALAEVAAALAIDPEKIVEDLAQLVEKSLVLARVNDQGERRYVLLEPVRQFGHRRFRAGPLYEQARAAHASYFLELSEREGPDLHGRKRKEALQRLERDADNLRAALRWYIDVEDQKPSLRFAHALWEGYWLNQGYFAEGRDWVEQILALSDPSAGYLYGSVRLGLGAFCWTLGHIEESLGNIQQALEIGLQIDEPHLIQWAYYWKAIVVFDISEFSIAEEALERSLHYADLAGAKRGRAWSIFYQAQIARVQGKIELAIRLYEQSLEVLAEEDVFGAGWCYIYLGHLAVERGARDSAREHLMKANWIFEDLDNPRGKGGVERGLGILALEKGDLEQSEMHFRRSRNHFESLGWIKMSSNVEIYLAFISLQQGRLEEATERLLTSLAYQDRERDVHSIAHLIVEFGLLAAKRGVTGVGIELIDAAEQAAQEIEAVFPHHLDDSVNRVRAAAESSTRRHPGRSLEVLTQIILTHRERWLEALSSDRPSQSPQG